MVQLQRKDARLDTLSMELYQVGRGFVGLQGARIE